MKRRWGREDQKIELILEDILRSRAKSRMYLYLLKNKGAETSDIINETKLHPSTVREILPQMYNEGIITREKTSRGGVGKNPYRYYPLNPIQLFKKYILEIEERLNNVIQFSSEDKTEAGIEIKIVR